jgi:hypothetical protein
MELDIGWADWWGLCIKAHISGRFDRKMVSVRKGQLFMDTTKLHIAMLGHKRIPSREGGFEVVVEELSTRIVQQGYQETCFNRMGYHVSGKEYDKGKLKNYKGITLKDVPTIYRTGFAAMTSSLFGLIQAAFGKNDLVHFHAEGTSVLLWLPKLLGKRCIGRETRLTPNGVNQQKIRSTNLIQKKCSLSKDTYLR